MSETLTIPRAWATDATLTPIERTVLLAIAARAEDGVVVAEQRVLSHWTGVHQSSACRATIALEQRGLLKITRRPNEANTFTVLTGATA